MARVAPGDPVEIEGPVLRGAAWRFRGYLRNERNGTESVEVIGGRPGEDRVRSFLPEQVFPVGGAQGRHRLARRRPPPAAALSAPPRVALDARRVP